ncbi:MAG: multicopper oxidase domain-containing protein [Sinobacteraceae bacterium]|nr:multicopper oxidase domain-containing protein [Nevskiaceae bacterium]MBV8852315.1 multicopper oxidase domain-containing protein [Nevskiaceae bacterium]
MAAHASLADVRSSLPLTMNPQTETNDAQRAGEKGPMRKIRWSVTVSLIVTGLLPAFPAAAQSFRVQCPTSTLTHPNAANNNAEPAYTGPTYPKATAAASSPADYATGKTGPVNGAIKCQQVGGGDGYASMADGTQTYMFSFGPLSGLRNIASGLPGTVFPSEFNAPIASTRKNTDPPTLPILSDLAPGYPTGLTDPSTAYNGAIGLVGNNPSYTLNIYDISEGCSAALPKPCNTPSNTVTVILNAAVPFQKGDQVLIGQGNGTDLAGYASPNAYTITAVGVANTTGLPAANAFQFMATTTGLPEVSSSPDATASSVPVVDGHVDARQIMDVGVMNGNIPAPLMAIDEDDEYFLTLTNVGMIMRPDLFEQHTIHFHGYPNASAFYDGVPDASVAINIGGSFTYYYLAPDAGTYFWHCHITPPEHLQMGMVGQMYVRPRQNRVPATTSLYDSLTAQQNDLRTACSAGDVLCSNPMPAVNTGVMGKSGGTISTTGTGGYAYNDGDGSTYYDVEVPLQMHGFDPNFHFVGMTFNNEGFADMKDKYFMLNGRSYPDTTTAGPLTTPSSDGVNHYSQPIPAIVSLQAGQRALLRISELSVTEYHTLTSLGIRMHVVGYNAKLLRDQDGNNMDYYTNSITLGGGESLDVILDSCLVRSNPSDPSSTCTTPMQKGTYYLYTSNLDHLSNDAENFGGQMTEVRVN